MKIIFLGTGSSLGIPVVGCDCSTCKKAKKNRGLQRSRSSILIQFNRKNILVDTSPDLREQLLENHVKRINAVLFTHEHFDHTMGLDDLRPLNWLHKKPVPLFAEKKTLKKIKKVFHYVFSLGGEPTKPRVTENEIKAGKTRLFGLKVKAIKVKHGLHGAHGFVFENKKRAAYFPDCQTLEKKHLRKLRGLDLLVLGVPREKSFKHMNLKDALEIVEELKPKKTLFTHISHALNVKGLNLPKGVGTAFDGMKVKLK